MIDFSGFGVGEAQVEGRFEAVVGGRGESFWSCYFAKMDFGKVFCRKDALEDGL